MRAVPCGMPPAQGRPWMRRARRQPRAQRRPPARGGGPVRACSIAPPAGPCASTPRARSCSASARDPRSVTKDAKGRQATSPPRPPPPPVSRDPRSRARVPGALPCRDRLLPQECECARQTGLLPPRVVRVGPHWPPARAPPLAPPPPPPPYLAPWRASTSPKRLASPPSSPWP